MLHARRTTENGRAPGIFLLLATLFLLLFCGMSAAQIYVSPVGSDSNNGTENLPYKTLEKARSKARSTSTAMTIYLRGGTYNRSTPFVLDYRDHKDSYRAYPGEKPVIDGGSMTSNIFHLEQNQYVTISGLTFQRGLGPAIVLYKGTSNVLSDCSFTSTGQEAIRVEYSSYTKIQKCDMQAFGIAYNAYNSTHTVFAGIRTIGANYTLIEQNDIHDAPSSAIWMSGDYITIQLNRIYRVCQKEDDQGAIYSNKALTAKGRVIKNNIIADINTTAKTTLGVHGVYWDEEDCGTDLIGNIFYNLKYRAVLLRGGRYHKIDGNVFQKVGTVIWVSAYGASSGRYPTNNVISNNIYWQYTKLLDDPNRAMKYLTISNNVEKDPLFAAPTSMNFVSPLVTHIPVASIGRGY